MKSLIACTLLILTLLSSTLTNNKKTKLTEIKIGSQIWANKNLNVSHYRNGDKIKQITSDMDWLMANVNKEPAWCYFEFDEANGPKYGKLYNGYAIKDKRGLAPKGWKIPSDADWKLLESHIGSNANKLKADDTNETGFSALYSGSINVNGGFMPEFFMAWTTTEVNTGLFYRRLNNYNIGIDRKAGKLGSGFSVRCIK